MSDSAIILRILSAIFTNMSAAYLFFGITSLSIVELIKRTALCILYAYGAYIFEKTIKT